jgi:hypothetical protein
MPKYYATRVVDPKLFMLNMCNIPQGYHIAADYLQCSRPPLYLNHLNTQSEASDWDDKIANIMKRSVWYEAEGTNGHVSTGMYHRLYLEWFDGVSLPPLYRVPNFTKFSGSNSVSIVVHVGQYLMRCVEISTHYPLTVRLFPLSLFESAFTWFTSLAPISFNRWANLEKKFLK